MDIKLAIKVAATWTVTAYVACYATVALFPGVREWFVEYALHARVEMFERTMNLTTFFYGLVFWVILAIIGAWVLAVLVNKFKRG
jgi:hypothetical protein